MTASNLRSWFRRASVMLALVLFGAACDDHSHDDDGHSHDDDIGTPSGATCPEDAEMLTYEDFGQAFVESYCTRCHSSELTGTDRMGATLDHDFDTLDGILAVARHIDQYAASGPDATNTQMPPSGDRPSMAEREMLGQWLACELARD